MYFFFFNDTATTEIYTLSLHDALPIFAAGRAPDVDAADLELRVGPGEGLVVERVAVDDAVEGRRHDALRADDLRSEEHTSELQSRQYLVCRLLLEKKKNKSNA